MHSDLSDIMIEFKLRISVKRNDQYTNQATAISQCLVYLLMLRIDSNGGRLCSQVQQLPQSQSQTI